MIAEPRRAQRLLALGAALGLAVVASQAPAQRTDTIAGTWDLFWPTKNGTRQKGHLVLTQNGNRLRGEIHGRGEISARGTVDGRSFTLRGSRMMVPYTIAGRWQGDRLQGSIRTLSVNRRFTGVRRRR